MSQRVVLPHVKSQRGPNLAPPSTRLSMIVMFHELGTHLSCYMRLAVEVCFSDGKNFSLTMRATSRLAATTPPMMPPIAPAESEPSEADAGDAACGFATLVLGADVMVRPVKVEAALIGGIRTGADR